MASKSPNFLQLHGEKLLLGAAVLLLLLAAWYFLLGSPYDATVSTGRGAAKAYALSEVEPELSSAAEQLKKRLAERRPTLDVPEVAAVRLAERHRQRMPTQALAMTARPPLVVEGTVAEVARQEMRLASVPLPTAARAAAGPVVIAYPPPDPDMVPAVQQLAQVIGKTTLPLDTRAAVVVAELDLDPWIKGLRDGNVPQGFVEGRVGVAGVQLWRQQMQADGSWGEAQRIAVLPEPLQVAVEAGTRVADKQEGQALIERLLAEPEPVLRATLPVSEQGPPAPDPDRDVPRFTPEEQEQYRRLLRERERINAQLELVRRRLRPGGPGGEGVEGGEPGQPPVGPRPPRGPVVGDDALGLGSVLPGPTAPRREGGPDAAAMAREAQLTQQLQGVEQQIETLRQQAATRPEVTPEDQRSRQPGLNDPGALNRPFGPRGNQFDQGLDERNGDGGITGGTVQLRAWDVTAQPDQTYRYRMTASLVNPLFGRDVSDEAAQAVTDVVAVGPAEGAGGTEEGWTQPVTLEPAHRFFMVNGNPKNATATVEVWSIYNGVWTPLEFELRPGDPIGGIKDIGGGTLSVDTGQIVVDVVSRDGLGGKPVMFILDPATDRFSARDVSSDANADERLRLQEDARRGADPAGQRGRDFE